MAKQSLVVAISIFPPGEPGHSLRISYDPDIPGQLLGYEVGKAIAKALKKRNKKKEATPES